MSVSYRKVDFSSTKDTAKDLLKDDLPIHSFEMHLSVKTQRRKRHLI